VWKWLAAAVLVQMGVSVAGEGGLEVVPDREPQAVFSGNVRKIAVVWRNSGDRPVSAELRMRLVQTTSATAVRVSEAPWKRLQVLPGQTITESAALDFPDVKAETRFLVRWLEGTNKVFGSTEVLVYPPDLLKELKSMAGEEEGALGLFDPQNQIKPLAKSAKVNFIDLEEAGVESFRGKLAIVGPFAAKAQMREGLAEQIQTIARKGVAVVWVQPPPEKRDKLQPSFYTVPENGGAVVVVQAGMVSNLPEGPQSQLNLIHFCELALHPEPISLPH